MREIKFRGKEIDGERWWYGSLAHFPDSQSAHIIPCGTCKGDQVICDFVEVQKETIGQFTGLTDELGNEIFEGDIVEWTSNYRGIKSKHKRKNPKKTVCEVVWSNAGLRLRTEDFPNAPWNCRLLKRERHYNVLGNIHDNPELLNTPKQ